MQNLHRAGVRALNACSPVRWFYNWPGTRRLKDIVKLPLLWRESTPRIKEIWTEFHLDKDIIAATTLTKDKYETILHNSKLCPNFILPVRPKPGAFYMLYSQFLDSYCMVTSLEEFKRYGVNAEPWLCLAMYPEIMQEKGHNIVLARAEIINTLELKKMDAERLMHLLIKFYCVPQDYSLVQTFNNNPRSFDFEEFIRTCP